MDKSVHVTFAITCLLAIVLLGLKMNAPVPCVEPGIVFTSEFPKIGESVIFKATGTDSSGVLWDFGDSSETTKGIVATHSYTKSGKFTVMAKTATGCLAARVVSISPKEPETKSVFPIVKLSSTTVFVGDRVLIEDQTPGANSWSWDLGENGQVSVERRVSMAYLTPGKKEISLAIKGDGISGTSSSIINVRERPEPGKKPVPYTPPAPSALSYKYHPIYSPKFKAAANSRNRDAALRPLVQMLCNQNGTHVKLNVGVLDEKSYNFYDFRTKLSNDEQSNWVVDSVLMRWSKSDGDNCIEDIYFIISSHR